jgi:DNA-3-methyladenine glycosylase II
LKASELHIAATHLQNSDTILAEVIKRVGPPQLRRERDAWKALSSSIIGQQVSVHAARAIRGRFAAIVPERDYPLPAEVLTASDETLRGAGLSGNKVLSLRDLARHFEEKKIVPRRFSKMCDEEIIEALIPVRGIGRWTAEMYLIFSLGRMDVLAVDDLGLRNAMKKLYELTEVPKPEAMREIAAPWQPYRSIASWYLWRSLDNEPKIK